MRNAAWQVLFLSASSRMHMPGCACEREERHTEAEALRGSSCDWAPQSCREIRCWMTKYGRGGMTEELLWKPIGCGNDRLGC